MNNIIKIVGVGVLCYAGKKLIDRFDNKLPVRLRKAKNKNIKHVGENYQLVEFTAPSSYTDKDAKIAAIKKVINNSVYGKLGANPKSPITNVDLSRNYMATTKSSGKVSVKAAESLSDAQFKRVLDLVLPKMKKPLN